MTRHLSLTRLVDDLRALEAGAITSASVLEILHDARIEESGVRRIAAWSDERYLRHLIFRDEWFEVLLLCWKPGQQTPVHTHNGQLGWATVVQGGLEVVDYVWHGCNKPENQNVVGIDCLAGATKIDMEAKAPVVATPGGAVGTVTKEQTIHRIACPPEVGEPSASIHIYSRPIDSCVAFDMEHGRCGRRTLKYDTVDGLAHSAP